MLLYIHMQLPCIFFLGESQENLTSLDISMYLKIPLVLIITQFFKINNQSN